MGHGHLAAYGQHVKTQVNVLMRINDADGPEVLLTYLTAVTALYGSSHYGMPAWTGIVSGVRAVLQDPAHPAWSGQGTDVVAAAPPRTPGVDELCAALREAPDRLPLPVLDWLTRQGVMMTGQTANRR
jgi:hypothetical protein